MKIFVIALQKEGKLIPASLEAVQAAKSLGGEVSTVILSNETQTADQLVSAGAGQVLAVTNDALGFFNEEIYTKAITELIGKHSPGFIWITDSGRIYPHTSMILISGTFMNGIC